MSNKFQVPSSLTLEPNPFEQSFAGKSSNGQEQPPEQGQVPPPQQQQQRLPGVQGLTSPAPLLTTPGQWQQGPRLSPAIMTGQDPLSGSYHSSMPSPAVLLGTAGPHPGPHPSSRATPHPAASSLSSNSSDYKVSKKSASKRTPTKAKPEPDEDDKKRTLFLERNRIAAVKCRQRKKQWVDDLKSKVDFYQAANEELAGEVARLKSQMDQVKQYLYSIQDPRRFPPQILSILEAPTGAAAPPPPPQQQQAPQPQPQQQQPQQPQPLAQQQPLQPPQTQPQPQHRHQQQQPQQQGDYQNVVLMVPQQVMMSGSRPS